MKKLLCVLLAALMLLACAPFALADGDSAGQAADTLHALGLFRGRAEDENGNPAAGPGGYAEVRYTYGSSTVTEYYYDAEGNPCEAAGGYYGRTVTKDGKGQVKSIEYLGEDGKLTLRLLLKTQSRRQTTFPLKIRMWKRTSRRLSKRKAPIPKPIPFRKTEPRLNTWRLSESSCSLNVRTISLGKK